MRKSTILEFSTEINASAKDVFEFHLNFENAIRITPALIRVRVVQSPEVLTEGSTITIEMCQFGFCIPWDVQIVKIVPYSLMIDVQSGRGPFLMWKHEHHFVAQNGRCTMIDKIEYVLPFGIFGRIIDRIMIRFIQKRIFAFRHLKMKSIFP